MIMNKVDEYFPDVDFGAESFNGKGIGKGIAKSISKVIEMSEKPGGMFLSVNGESEWGREEQYFEFIKRDFWVYFFAHTMRRYGAKGVRFYVVKQNDPSQFPLKLIDNLNEFFTKVNNKIIDKLVSGDWVADNIEDLTIEYTEVDKLRLAVDDINVDKNVKVAFLINDSKIDQLTLFGTPNRMNIKLFHICR